MISRVSLLFFPVLLLSAQEQAPPDVDQELRARVTAFYRNFLAESFTPRKGEPFVAEDTKDYFYNAGKEKYLSFQIEKVTFSDNFTKAVVVVVGKQERHLGGQSVVMDVPQDTHWKIEDGKWYWYYNPADYCLTPMCGKTPPPATAAEGAAAVRPKNTSPEAIRSAGLAVLEQQPMGLDKSTITMIVDQPSSAEVVFTNGADGDIQIALDGPVVRGLKAKLDKMTVPGHGKAIISFEYDPSDKSGPKDVWEPTGNIPFRIIAAPFNRIFPVFVQFVGPK